MVKKIIEWDAQEYVQREKNWGWYLGLILVGAAFVALSVWLQAWTFTALIVLSVVALIVYSVRPPRKIHYVLDSKGLKEGEKMYEFKDFKAFGVMIEGRNCSVVLTPRKRFSARVTVYFPQNRGEEIVDMFGSRLPMEEVKLDFLDKIVKWLRI